ncbi:MAG: hypothetical protein V8R91_07540 [Butyricimonas faecihominis]
MLKGYSEIRRRSITRHKQNWYHAGDIRYRDVNGNEGVIDVDDAVHIGFPETPRWCMVSAVLSITKIGSLILRSKDLVSVDSLLIRKPYLLLWRTMRC